MDNFGRTSMALSDLDVCPVSAEDRNEREWPSLDWLLLGQSEKDQRRFFLGGSDANAILSGDRERIFKLWHEKRGEAQAEDLSSRLAVMLGCWTEPFNRQWYEQISGERVTGVGTVLVSSTHKWRRCTLDGIVESSGAVWEAKHTSAFAKPEDVLERYMPQLQHNMAVAGANTAILSVIFGNQKYETFEVQSDWLYQLELLQAEEDFWECVRTGREPVPAELPAAPKPVGTREVCLHGNNAWASAACDWLEHRHAAKAHASACTVIKELVEPDVARAFGNGIEAKRSKSGAISIREFAA